MGHHAASADSNARTRARSRRPLPALVAVLTVLAVLTGCSFDPIREVEGPASTPTPAPEALAFSGDEAAPTPTPEEADARPQATPDDLAVPAAQWRVDTDTAQVGVHSAPDVVYTRIGVLEPDDLVLATGRRADVDGVRWMEISWGDATGWVIEIAFAPADA